MGAQPSSSSGGASAGRGGASFGSGGAVSSGRGGFDVLGAESFTGDSYSPSSSASVSVSASLAVLELGFSSSSLSRDSPWAFVETGGGVLFSVFSDMATKEMGVLRPETFSWTYVECKSRIDQLRLESRMTIGAGAQRQNLLAPEE